MVLADAEEVQADLVGQHTLLDDVADDLGVRRRGAVARRGDVSESVHPEFQHRDLSMAVLVDPRSPRDGRYRRMPCQSRTDEATAEMEPEVERGSDARV